MRGVVSVRSPRVQIPFRPRPPRASISNMEGRSDVPCPYKVSLLQRDRVPLDVREFLRIEGPLIDAEDQRRPMQGDLLVHVLEEVQDACEVVVDHEVLDPVEQDDGAGSVGHEVRDQVAQAVQVVRIDVVLAQRRREPDDADVLVPATPDDVVRMLARDVHRTPPGIDRLLERREGLLRLLLLPQVGAAFLEVLLLPEEKVLEKLVLLESEQERPREPPHGTTLPSGGRFLYVSYRLSHVRLIWAQSVGQSETPGRVPCARLSPRSGGTEALSRDGFSSARYGVARRRDHRRLCPRRCV